MTSSKVYDAVRSYVSNHDHKFENVFVYQWESDSFSVTSSNYVYEIEVKVSRSDFLADFKKPKHHFFKGIRNEHSILVGDRTWYTEGWPNKDRNPDLKDFKIEHQGIQALKIGYKTCPNKFYFACPVGMITEAEVPKYAGLIYVMDSGSHRIVKGAPFLHKEPIIPAEMLFDKYMWKYINMKADINYFKREKEFYVKKIKEEEDTRTDIPEHQNIIEFFNMPDWKRRQALW